MVSKTDGKPYQVRTLQIPILDEAEKKRFESKYRVDESGCWLWLRPDDKGYGTFSVRGTTYRAHRVAYTLYKGPIPDGLTIDHLCRTRHCVNHDHLQAVTNKVNVLRGDGSSAQRARQTHCVHGHEFDEANTYITIEGYRSCRPCRRRHHNGYRAAARAAQEAQQ